MEKYQITLKDGRVVIFEEANEEAAIRAAQRWQDLNPPGAAINYYDVQLDDGTTARVPGVSEEAAAEFTQAWGPQDRAMSDARQVQENSPWDATSNAVNGTTLGLDKIALAAGAAGLTGAQNLIGQGPGYGMGDAFNASRQAQNDAQAEYNEDSPILGMASSLLGGAATPGVAALGNWIKGGRVAGQAGQGATAALNSTMGQVLRAGGSGVPVGATAGLLNSSPGDEANATARGGVIGGVTGGAVPVAARAASGAVRLFGGPARQALNTATGGRVPLLQGGGADRQAMIRLAEAMRADGLEETTVRAALNAAMTRGMDANLLDIVGQNATRTRGLIQGAAMKPGPAQTAAAQYRNQTAADLQDRVIDRAYELTPGERRTAEQYRQALDDTQSSLAETDYAPVYEQRVPVDARVDGALADMGPELGQARRTAQVRRDAQRVDEIEGLTNSDEIVDDVSAATLDRIQRRFGQSGRNLTRSLENPDPETASGYFSRQSDLNAVLDEIPELAPARATYRGYQTAQDATDLGQKALRPATRPADYADELARLNQISQDASATSGRNLPTAQTGAGVGMRDEIVNTVSNLPEGATGFLNRLSTARNAGQALEATYGGAGKPFQDDVGGFVDSLQNARFIDPSTGSQTASRMAAEDLVSPLPASKTAFIMGIVNRIRRGATITDAEREAIVRLSTQPLSPNGIPVPVNRRPELSGRFAPILSGQAGTSGGR